MRYKIKDRTYNSENAARSHHQQQKDLLNILSEFAKFNNVLDYGCGKLRYFKPLRRISQNLHLSDSEIQLTRIQKIHGKNNSVEEYASKFKNVNVIHLKSLMTHKGKFDFILCSNVLSAIPIKTERKKVLNNIKYLLNKNGLAIIVVQYKNSRFEDYFSRPGSVALNDGFLFDSGGQTRYYATINPRQLDAMLENSKFDIIRKKNTNGRGIYIISNQK